MLQVAVLLLLTSQSASIIDCKPLSGAERHKQYDNTSVGNYGCDVSSLILPETFQCIKNKSLNFVIIRAYRSNCQPDENAIHTIANARLAGIEYIDVYMFPSPRCSKSASEQVKSMVESLEGENYGQIWLDIEGSQYWLGSDNANQKFFEELLQASKSYGKVVGIYASSSQWSSIMGYNYTGGLSQKLWYAHYDNNPSFNDFVPFGGWSSPAMKQYAGDVKLCEADIDRNWW